MRRIQIIILWLAVAMTVAAATFTGTVVDETGQSFAFANVVLLDPVDSTFLSGTMTDDAGAFSLTAEQSSVIVKLSYIGYETKCVYATTGNLGTIQLHPEATMLGEVVVKGVRPTYKLTTEGIKTDVEGTLLSKVGTATEVLGNLPGVQKRGTSVEVFGKGTPLIFINGRQMRNESELAQLSSENIQSVELITNPGAKYKADVESVILIKTKRPQGEGFSFDTQASVWACKYTDLALGLNWNYRHKGLDVFGSVWYNDDRYKDVQIARRRSMAMTFGERIFNARVKQNLTVHEVAAQLSISETTLRRYELDQLVNPRYELVVACSRVLGIPLSSLMGWDSDNVEADIPVLCRNMQRSSVPMTQKAIRVFRMMLADKNDGE